MKTNLHFSFVLFGTKCVSDYSFKEYRITHFMLYNFFSPKIVPFMR